MSQPTESQIFGCIGAVIVAIIGGYCTLIAAGKVQAPWDAAPEHRTQNTVIDPSPQSSPRDSPTPSGYTAAVWHTASITNKTEALVTFYIFRPMKEAWGITTIPARSTKTFVEKNHAIFAFVAGRLIQTGPMPSSSGDTLPDGLVKRTSHNPNSYVLEDQTFRQFPSQAEQNSVRPNFLERSGNDFVIVSSAGNPLTTFVPEGLLSSGMRTVFDDPKAEIVIPDRFAK